MTQDATAPPHDLDAERALLGSLLINPAAIASIIPLVTPGVFYREAHRMALHLRRHAAALPR